MYGVIQKWSMADGQASEREDGWTCGLAEARTELRQRAEADSELAANERMDVWMYG